MRFLSENLLQMTELRKERTGWQLVGLEGWEWRDEGSGRELVGTGGSVSVSMSPSWCDGALPFAACHHGGSGVKAQSVLFLTTACQSTTSQNLKCDNNNNKKQTARARTGLTAHGYLNIFLAPVSKASTRKALCHA